MFKNRSIRQRITTFYAVILIAVVLVAGVITFISSSYYIRHNAKADLVQAVQGGFEQVDFDGKTITLDSGFDSYYRGVSLVIYSSKGERLKGAIPQHFPEKLVLTSGEYQTVSDEGGAQWLVYDNYQLYGDDLLWIRGIYSMDNRADDLNVVLLVIALGLPLLVLISLLGGYYISKKALNPVAEMAAAAEKISGGDLSGRVPLGTHRDELYRLGTTVNDMLSRLEKSFEAEKQFSADVSHELKTPVAVMKAECEYALSKWEAVAEDNSSPDKKEEDHNFPDKNQEAMAAVSDSLTAIKEQCDRMTALTTQLLHLTRTIDPATALNRETVDLSILCESAAEEMSAVSENLGVTISTDVKEDITYEGDETLLLQLIMNLLTNAVKYSDPDKMTGGRAEIVLRLAEEADKVVLEVEDNGIGIAEEDLPHIFDRLYKADKSRVHQERGETVEEALKGSFGIGLSVVKWIAEAHGGSVTAESTLGEKTIFRMELPK